MWYFSKYLNFKLNLMIEYHIILLSFLAPKYLIISFSIFIDLLNLHVNTWRTQNFYIYIYMLQVDSSIDILNLDV